MEASIIDLRYKMHDVLNALDRNEKITVLYHGKQKGVILPVHKPISKKVQDHAFFGMSKDDKESVAKTMKKLRQGRYNDI